MWRLLLSFVLVAAACASSPNAGRAAAIDLQWDGQLVRWSIANRNDQALLIEDPAAVGYDMDWLETPLGVYVRVADSNGSIIPTGETIDPAYPDDRGEGWYSAFWMSSSLPPDEPPLLTLNPGEAIHYVLDPRRLVTGLREEQRPATATCRVQVRGMVRYQGRRTWTFETSDWAEMPCAELFSDWQRP